MRARALLKHSLIFGRSLFKFTGHILHMTTSYMDYILIMHRGNAHVRACASARVINCSLIYGRVLFKFTVNILQITTSSKGYVHVHAPGAYVRARVCVRASVCERASAWLNVQLSLDGFSSNLMGTYYKCYMGYILIMFKYRVRVRARA
jgi:hypothetical protein